MRPFILTSAVATTLLIGQASVRSSGSQSSLAQPTSFPLVEVQELVLDNGFKVLVVEDDARVLASTMGALGELGHHAIACGAPAHAEGLLIDHADVDLILSDVLMPGMTGPELIAQLGPRFPYVAVLFVTGYAGEANASEFGNHSVLRKPFTLVGLERAIAEAMARHRPAPPEQIAAE